MDEIQTKLYQADDYTLVDCLAIAPTASHYEAFKKLDIDLYKVDTFNKKEFIQSIKDEILRRFK